MEEKGLSEEVKGLIDKTLLMRLRGDFQAVAFMEICGWQLTFDSTSTSCTEEEKLSE